MIFPLRVWVGSLLFGFRQFLGYITLVQKFLILGVVFYIDENRFTTPLVGNNDMIVIFVMSAISE